MHANSWSLQTLTASREFRLRNLRVQLAILLIGLGLVTSAYMSNHYSHQPAALFPPTLLSLGCGAILFSLLTIAYQVRTREAFRDILADVVPTISSGVIVHPNHHDVLDRKDAVEKYLRHGGIVRLVTSTGDNYLKEGEPARDALVKKITEDSCEMRVLLDLPVSEFLASSRVGQRRKTPQQLLDEHRALMPDYEKMIDVGRGHVMIRFFSIPVHVNMIMYGDERSYSAPILHSISGRDLPCYEMYPSGSESLFLKYRHDFDTLFDKAREGDGIVTDFDVVKQLYIASAYDFTRLRQLFFRRFPLRGRLASS